SVEVVPCYEVEDLRLPGIREASSVAGVDSDGHPLCGEYLSISCRSMDSNRFVEILLPYKMGMSA
ncbi:MAG: hypothetical protein WCR98_04205, partial [Saccharofermentanales bacterium]